MMKTKIGLLLSVSTLLLGACGASGTNVNSANQTEENQVVTTEKDTKQSKAETSSTDQTATENQSATTSDQTIIAVQEDATASDSSSVDASAPAAPLDPTVAEEQAVQIAVQAETITAAAATIEKTANNTATVNDVATNDTVTDATTATNKVTEDSATADQAPYTAEESEVIAYIPTHIENAVRAIFASTDEFNAAGYLFIPMELNGKTITIEVRRDNPDGSVANLVTLYDYEIDSGQLTRIDPVTFEAQVIN